VIWRSRDFKSRNHEIATSLDHPARSATTGSTSVARLAGSQHENHAKAIAS
jgi:hypothetical protein